MITNEFGTCYVYELCASCSLVVVVPICVWKEK